VKFVWRLVRAALNHAGFSAVHPTWGTADYIKEGIVVYAKVSRDELTMTAKERGV